MKVSRGVLRSLVVLFGVAVLLVPTAAQADPADYETPLFGIANVGSALLVADAGQGIVNADTGALVVPLPGVTDIAPRSGGGLWAITSGNEPTVDSGQAVWRISPAGVPTRVANLFEYERRFNPHPEAVDSNPFDVADAGGGSALVADAGGNSVLLVSDGNSPNSDVASRVKLVATLPDEVVSTANAQALLGEMLPPFLPAQAVATSLAIGADGGIYVGELKGFPAPLGESRVWRIDPGTRNARCGQSHKCQVVLDGLTSIIDLTWGPDGRLNVAQIDDASWLALEIPGAPDAIGGSVHACNLQTKACSELVDGQMILTSIAYRGSVLWGATWALVPGLADVAPLS
jgi:hypothetical protein